MSTPQSQTAHDQHQQRNGLNGQYRPIPGDQCFHQRTGQFEFGEDLFFKQVLYKKRLYLSGLIGVKTAVATKIKPAKHEGFMINALFKQVIHKQPQGF